MNKQDLGKKLFCKDCLWFDKTICRATVPGQHVKWPQVSEKDWCGEYHPNSEILKVLVDEDSKKISTSLFDLMKTIKTAQADEENPQ